MYFMNIENLSATFSTLVEGITFVADFLCGELTAYTPLKIYYDVG